MHKMTEAELGYLAGIIDGEGCIDGILSTKSYRDTVYTQYRVRCRVAMQERAAPEWLHRVTGIGNVYKRKNSSGRYHTFTWSVQLRSDMKDLLEILLPYLIIKKKQAMLVLKMIELIDEHEYGTEWPDTIDELIEQIRLEKKLNYEAVDGTH